MSKTIIKIEAEDGECYSIVLEDYYSDEDVKCFVNDHCKLVDNYEIEHE